MLEQITTAEELAALPEMSLVVDAYGATCIRHHQTGDPLRDWVRVTPASSTVHHPPYLPAEIERVGWGKGPDQPIEPARVLPSREAVREAILSAWRAGGLNGPWVWPAADAVLALFANTPTVEQVKAEAVVEFIGRIRPGVNDGSPLAEILDHIAATELSPAQPAPDQLAALAGWLPVIGEGLR